MNVFEQLRDMGDSAPLLYVIATGAGAGLQRKIWDIPGISNFFVGAAFPYDMGETDRVLGFTPNKYVSEATAMDLAQTAYIRAWKPPRKAIGLGMTCSVSSLKPHRGDHRIVTAIVGDDGCWVLDAIIPKLEQDGRWKDGLLADLLGKELIDFYINGTWDALKFIDCKVTFEAAGELASNRIMANPLFKVDGSRNTTQDIVTDQTIFFPGAFNPPHQGHFEGAKAAYAECIDIYSTSKEIIFCTTINPPHKPTLSVAEMLQRARLMRGHNFLLTKNDPLFLDKAKNAPGAHFVIGADTMDRMLDPKWGPEIQPMLYEMSTLNTQFWVLGRTVDGQYLTSDDIQKKREGLDFLSLFTKVPFRLDISSSELRSCNETF